MSCDEQEFLLGNNSFVLREQTFVGVQRTEAIFAKCALFN